MYRQIEQICGAARVSRTTLKLDSDLVDLAMKLSGAKTKTEAINLALDEFVRRRERELLRRDLGSFDLQLSLDELRHLRHAN
jgi:Arc/MetJ family transcription regulator